MIFNPNVMAAAGGGGGAVVGTYTGNGEESRTIEFDFEPALVIIMQGSNYMTTIINLGTTGAAYSIAISKLASTLDIPVTFSGKTMTFPTLSTAPKKAINSSGTPYSFVAIPKA